MQGLFVGISDGTTGREQHLLLLLLLKRINFYQSWTILKPHKMEDIQVSGGKPSEEVFSAMI